VLGEFEQRIEMLVLTQRLAIGFIFPTDRSMEIAI